MVTKKELVQYVRWKRRISRYRKELTNKNIETTDSVIGSMHDFPYIQRTFTIQGRNVSCEEKLKAEIADLKAKCKRIEAFIESVEDDDLQDILRLKFIRGYSWPKVMREMQCTISPDAARMRVERFFQKSF